MPISPTDNLPALAAHPLGAIQVDALAAVSGGGPMANLATGALMLLSNTELPELKQPPILNPNPIVTTMDPPKMTLPDGVTIKRR